MNYYHIAMLVLDFILVYCLGYLVARGGFLKKIRMASRKTSQLLEFEGIKIMMIDTHDTKTPNIKPSSKKMTELEKKELFVKDIEEINQSAAGLAKIQGRIDVIAELTR